MPHNLFTDPRTGQISMMYAGDPPWHRLGTRLENPATSVEAIKAAQLDWEVDKYPLHINTPQGYLTVERQYAIMRTDYWEKGMRQPFGIVGSEYQPLQNEAAFTFFDDIVGQKAAIYETAGALGQGERIWILAKLPETIKVVGNDICDKYLLLSNSHDGKSSVQVKFTPIRVVCQNTLTMALNWGPTIKVAHLSNIRERLRQSEETLGIIRKQFVVLEKDFQQMAAVQMDSTKFLSYFKIIFPDPRDPEDQKGRERTHYNRLKAEQYFLNGHGNDEPGVKGTLWAAYNGVAEMVDYPLKPQDDEKCLNSAWFGDGYLLKARAFRVAMENIKTWAG